MLVEVDAAETAHAEFLHHAAGNAAGPFQIAAGPVGDFPIAQLLGQGPAQTHLDFAL